MTSILRFRLKSACPCSSAQLSSAQAQPGSAQFQLSSAQLSSATAQLQLQLQLQLQCQLACAFVQFQTEYRDLVLAATRHALQSVSAIIC